MHRYQLSPSVYLEPFAEASLLLVADRDLLVTVNPAAAQLFEHARAVAGTRLFSRADGVDFLLDHYDLSLPEAESKLRSLLGFGLKQRLVNKVPAAYAEQNPGAALE